MYPAVYAISVHDESMAIWILHISPLLLIVREKRDVQKKLDFLKLAATRKNTSARARCKQRSQQQIEAERSKERESRVIYAKAKLLDRSMRPCLSGDCRETLSCLPKSN